MKRIKVTSGIIAMTSSKPNPLVARLGVDSLVVLLAGVEVGGSGGAIGTSFNLRRLPILPR